MSIAPFLLASTQDAGDTLARHMEHLYSLAQVATLSPEDAAQLVEATYRTAIQRVDEIPPEPQLRDWLVRQMMQLHRDREVIIRDDEPQYAAKTDAPQSDDLRQRLANGFIERELPSAFATLTSEQRLLLVLCEVQEMEEEVAALVLGTGAESVRRNLVEARAILDARLQEAASASERRLMLTSLPDGWRRSALRRMTESELNPLPPTLHARIRGAVRVETSPAPEAKPVGSENPPHAPRGFAYRFRRVLVMLLLIAVAGGGLYLSSRYVPKVTDDNLITISAIKAHGATLTLRTRSSEQAEQFVHDRLSWRLTVPDIDRASLRGVGIRQIAAGVDVPVFLYDDTVTGYTITLFAYNYALLDRHASRVSLESDILRQIEDEGHFDLHDLGAERVLVWRHRDEIFIAVTPGDADELRERIYNPS